MTKRQRTLLFSILLLAFFILAPGIFLYSQGYRVDLQGKRLSQTGALYLKAAPPRANVLVDGELKHKTDFLFGSVLAGNFFPGKYFIEVVKEGYQPWQKILEVKEKSVTEAKNIILFPEKPSLQKLADNVQNFWVSPDQQIAILQEKQGASWQLSLLNLETGGKEHFLSSANSKETILSLSWSQDSERVLIKKVSKEQIVSEVRAIAKEPCLKTPCGLGFLGNNQENAVFASHSPNYVLYTRFLSGSQVLLTANYVTTETPVPVANNVAVFEAHGNLVVWLDSEGTLWQKDLIAASDSVALGHAVFPPKKETSLRLFLFGETVFIKEHDTLFSIFPGAQPRELASSVTSALLSPDKSKVAMLNGNELLLLFLEDSPQQPQRKAGDLVFLTRSGQPIENLSWLGSHYLLFSLGDLVRAMEIDGRDRLNTATLADLPLPRVFWNESKHILYVLSDSALSASEKLFP